MITFADLLKRARRRRGYSQTDLAIATGLAASAISHFESGRRQPSYHNLCLLIVAMRVDANELIESPLPAPAWSRDESLRRLRAAGPLPWAQTTEFKGTAYGATEEPRA